MTPNETYVSRFDLRLTDDDGVCMDTARGRSYLATAFQTIVCAETGEVMKLPLHVARNPLWYFARAGFGQHAAQAPVTQAEYVAALVRGNEGLDAGELYKVAQAEMFAPMGGKPIPYNGFTTLLAKDTGIEMRQDGVPVVGTAATRGKVHGCTYHVKAKVRRTDGWAA